MQEIDRHLQEAVRKPKCTAARGSLADHLREDNEPDLAFVIESDEGEDLLVRLKEASKDLKLPVSVKLLWYVHVVAPRVTPPTNRQNGPYSVPGIEIPSRRRTRPLIPEEGEAIPLPDPDTGIVPWLPGRRSPYRARPTWAATTTDNTFSGSLQSLWNAMTAASRMSSRTHTSG